MLLDRIPVRFRLSLGHAFWMALVFLGVGYGLFRVVEHNLYQSVDASLMTSARSIRDTRFVRGFGPPLMKRFLSQYFGERYVRLHAQLVDLSGNISASTDGQLSLPVNPKALEAAEKGQYTLETFYNESIPIRLITLPVIKFGRFTGELIQVGIPLDHVQHTLRGITWVLWTALPTGLALSVLFGYLLTARALKPVQRLSEAASQLSSDDLAVRLPTPQAKDELRVLTLTFNDMLNRLDDAFKRLRRFTGDVSHELRTPLAVLRGEAELALRRERSPEEYKEALKTIVTESNNMTSIVEDLLLLARAEAKSVPMTWETIEPEKFVDDLCRAVEMVYQSRYIELKVSTKLSQPFEGSSNLLSLAIKNVMINAAKHSKEGQKVELYVDQDNSQTTFIVRDYGEGIPADSIDYIFDPFYRADTARNRAAGGAGIGLSLAKALVKLHNGTIKVTSEVGSGASFIIAIPNRGDQPAVKESKPNPFAKATREQIAPAQAIRSKGVRNPNLADGLPIL